MSKKSRTDFAKALSSWYVDQALYAIAARDAGHHNNYDNWNVRKENELIYELNWRRRFINDPIAGEQIRRKIVKINYRQRALGLAACLRYARWQAAKTGLQYILNEPPFGARLVPESVLSWAEVSRFAGVDIAAAPQSSEKNLLPI